jgi:hypothetical protein
MSVPSDKPHLKYESVDAWVKGENVPPEFLGVADEEARSRYITQYGELRRHLFAKHLATLTQEEQAQFEQGSHPSLSHAFADRAQPIAEEFQRELQRLGFVARVELGWYHFDRIVFSVVLATNPTPEEHERLPWLFRGFEALYLLEDTAQE